jgi:hypothetical protein
MVGGGTASWWLEELNVAGRSCIWWWVGKGEERKRGKMLDGNWQSCFVVANCS